MKIKRLAKCIVLLIFPAILFSCGSTSTLEEYDLLEDNEVLQGAEEEKNSNEDFDFLEDIAKKEGLLEEKNSDFTKEEKLIIENEETEGDVYTSSVSVNDTTIYVSSDNKRQIVVDKINSNKQLKKESSDIEISSFYINDYDGGNSDKIANPGEYIKMDIGVHNKGFFDINGLKCVMTAPEEFITIQKYDDGEEANNKNYKTLRKNGYSYGNYHNYGSNPQFDRNYTPYRFTISKNVPYGTIIPLTFTFTDEIGSKWVSILELPVKKVDAKVEIIGKDINDREANSQFNNSDRIINPGETIYMDIGVKNTGNSNIVGLKGTLSCDSPYITIMEEHNSYYYGKLVSNGISGYKNHNDREYRSDGTPYGFTVSKDAPYGTKIPLKFTFENSAGEIWTDEIITEVKKIDAEVKIVGRVINDGERFSQYNNSDKIINPGETIYMDIGIKNTGNSNIVGLKGTFSCDSPYITILEEHNSYDYGKLVSHGISGCGNRNDREYRSDGTPYGFTVLKDAPYGTKIPLKFTFENSAGEIWTDEIITEVKKIDAEVKIVGRVINDGERFSQSNNSDKIINPGETIYMDIGIKNTGNSNIVGLKGTFSCDSPYITILEEHNSYNYGKLVSHGISGYRNHNDGEYRSYGTPYGFTVSKDIPSGTNISLKFTFENELGEIWTDEITSQVKNIDSGIEIVGSIIKDSENYSEINNNGDKIINPGETIFMDIGIKNIGKSNIVGLMGTLSCDSPYITIFEKYNSYNYGKLVSHGISGYRNHNDGEYRSYGTPYGFEISKDIPLGTKIPLKFTFIGSFGQTWECVKEIEVKGRDGNFNVCDLGFASEKKYFKPNSEISFDLKIKDTGKSFLPDLKVSLSSDSEYIDFVSFEKKYENINPNYGDFTSYNRNGEFYVNRWSYLSEDEIKAYYPFKIKISGNTPNGIQIPITATFTDSIGDKWEDKFYITVVSGSGEIKLINYELLDDTSLNFINNGDKKVNPGEQIFMDVGIHNIGNSSYNIVSTISSDSEYITIEDNKIVFEKIEPSCFSSSVSKNIFIEDGLKYFDGESYYEPFKFTVSKSAPVGSKIPIKINFKDSDMGKEWSDTIEIEVTK